MNKLFHQDYSFSKTVSFKVLIIGSLILFFAIFQTVSARSAEILSEVTPPSAYEEDRNHDMIPDLQPLQPSYLPWGPNTSGPFFTGTAEVEPVGSFFLEPYWYDYLQPSLGTSILSMPQRLSIGITRNWEFDVSIPIVVNQATSPTTPTGQSVQNLGVGDTLLWFKRQFTDDSNAYSFWARPAMTLEAQFTLPTGHYLNLNPNQYTTDQTGDGSFDQGIYLIVRKHFKPFMVYFQAGDILLDPTSVGSGYTMTNQISTTTQPQKIVNGNLLYYAGAFEHVLNDTWGAGYVLEFFGETQAGQSLLFGAANTPAWSFLWVDPAIEVTWPYEGPINITWGAGMALPVYQSNYPRTYTPMGTITIYYNGPFGYRGE
jgi:hypothetical protein